MVLPTSAGKGGFKRGLPCFPSKLSISAYQKNITCTGIQDNEKDLLSHRAILIFQCNLSLSNELKFLNKIKSKLTVTHRFLLPVSEFKVVTVVSVKWLKYLLTKTSKRAKELAVIHFHNVTPVMHFDKIHVDSHYTKYNRPR